MALRKTFHFTGQKTVSGDFWSIDSTPDSVVVDCYIKVQYVSGNKELAKAQVAFIGEKFVGFKSYDFSVNLNSENFIKQAYEHLKTLEEFSFAIDC